MSPLHFFGARAAAWLARVHVVCGAFMLLLPGCASLPPNPPTDAAVESIEQGDGVATVRVQELPFGVGDRFDVTVFRHDELDFGQDVPPTGDVFVPLVGEYRVVGLTPTEARRQLTGELSRFVVAPQVRVTVSNRASQRVVVLGEVRTPGVYTLSDDGLRVFEALGLAGGYSPDADVTQIALLRQDGAALRRYVLDMDLAAEGALAHNAQRQRGDVLVVPPTGLASAERFFEKVATIMRPFLLAEQAVLIGYEIDDRINDGDSDSTTVVIP